jgi:hypothetical protein
MYMIFWPGLPCETDKLLLHWAEWHKLALAAERIVETVGKPRNPKSMVS